MKSAPSALLLLLSVAASGNGQEPSTKVPPNPDPVSALKEQHQELRVKLKADFAKLKELPESERQDAGNKIYAAFERESAKIGDSLLAIVKSDPKSSASLSAMEAALPIVREKEARQIILKALIEHHIANPSIGRLIADAKYLEADLVDTLLERVLKENPDRTIQGQACYALSFRAANEAEKISLLERCANEFGEAILGKETLAIVANRELNAIRNIKVGRVPPDIVGKDMDGDEFRLSYYRGKVVVLDFWGYW